MLLRLPLAPICHRSRRRALGVTLIELMVALGIGSFLIIGAITVFMQSRMTYRVSESVARLQENGRFALSAIEPDIRMASFYGLTTRGARIAGGAGKADPIGPVALAADCGPNWSIDLAAGIEGTNDRWGWTCAPNAEWAPGSDSFVIRRVADSPATGALESDRLYVQSSRFQDGVLFQGPDRPTGFEAEKSATHMLVVSGYYVSRNSTLDTAGNAVPSLRRKALQGLRVVDQEVMPGVEDMQIQFGVDTDPPESDARGVVNRYVNADDPILDPSSDDYLPAASIIALRVWLRVRAERPENGFTDTTTYTYAGHELRPQGRDADYRRIVVSKTIYLRNNRPAS